MAGLRATGRTARIAGTPGFGQVALWASINSSKSVGRHGFYAIQRVVPGEYSEKALSVERDLNTETFWNVLSRAGHPVAVVDMVRAPLGAVPNGVQVCDWLTHMPTDPPRSTPAALVGALIDTYGSDPLCGNADAQVAAGMTVEELHRRLQDRLRIKERAVVELMRERPWDLFATAFSEPHDLAHAAWHQHERNHPHFDPVLAARIGDPLRSLYERIDRSLASFLEAAGHPLTTVIVAGPGISTLATANNLLDRILMRLDRPWLRYLWGRIPPHPSRRKFFPLEHNALSGAIRINLIGREPGGIVHPSDMPAVIAGLVADLGALRNRDGGEPIVDQVVVVREHTDGAMVDHLPDLLVVWRRDRPIKSVWSPKTGTVTARWFLARSGDHTPDTELLVHTSEGAPAAFPTTIACEDVATSICGYFGLDMADVDGTAHPLVD